MQAYHNNGRLKEAVIALMREHEAADRIQQGSYAEFAGDDGPFIGGCAVGCTLESLRRIEGLSEIAHSDHQLYERYLGVPQALARIEDSIFEGLDHEGALTWPRRFADAIRPGADLSMVWPKWLRRLLADPSGGVQAGVAKREAIRPAVDGVIALFDQWIASGVKPPIEDWRRARFSAAAASAAAYAAAYAADAAYAAASAAAAYAAAYAAAAASAAADAAADAAAASAAAASAAAYAADAAARREARLAERRRQADWLIELLAEA